MAHESLQEARSLMNAGRWSEALAKLDGMLARDPQHLDAAYFRAQVLENTDRFDEAVAAYDALLPQLAGDPSRHAEILVSKGIALVDGDRLDEADRCFDEALRTHPRLARVWVHKARAAARRKDFAGSVECCDRALALDAGDPRAWNNKAFGLLQLGRIEESMRCGEKAVALKPDYGQAWIVLGQAYERHGDPVRGQEHINRGVQLAMGHPPEVTMGHQRVPAPTPKPRRWWPFGR